MGRLRVGRIGDAVLIHQNDDLGASDGNDSGLGNIIALRMAVMTMAWK